ncbi:hypothetical protein J3L12_02325 [Meiothermus sp. CFH 77666]|nr:hypothetical protein [Meiothermus sp. CFH 77666]
MEKTIQLKLKAPRLLKFVSEGHHKKVSRPYADSLSNLGEASSGKPVVGFFGYSYTVSYSWVSQGSALDPASSRVSLVSCPCGAGI